MSSPSEVEEWTTCFSCEQYEVSTSGNIRLKSNGSVRKLQNRHGHWHVSLHYRGDTIGITVSKEVLSSFVRPPCENEQEYAYHVNGNTRDNRLSNLKWTTELRHVDAERIVSSPVRVVTPDGKIDDHISALEAAEALKVERHQIYDVLRGIRVPCIDDYEIVYIRATPSIDAEVREILMGSNKILVSSDGFIREATSSKWRRGTVEQGRDYRRVSFQFDMDGERHIGKSGKDMSHKEDVHKLVALAFLGPRPGDKWVIDHIDEDKTNNHRTNLQYITRSENQLKSYAQGTSVGPNKKVVYKYNLNGEFTGESFESASAAAREFGPNQQAAAISSCCNGSKDNWKGFEWSYIVPGDYDRERDNIKTLVEQSKDEKRKKRKEKNGPPKSTGKVVYAYNKDTNELVGEWSSGKAAAKETGAGTSNISNCIAGKLKHTKGLVFSRTPPSDSESEGTAVKKAKTS